MGYIINEIEGITNRGFDKSSKCIRANSRQEITLKEFKDDIDVVIKRVSERVHYTMSCTCNDCIYPA